MPYVESERSVVFVVDDDARVREALTTLLESAGLEVISFPSAKAFLEVDRPDAAGCLLLDLDLPDISGLQLQAELLEQQAPPIVFLTGHGDIPSSVKAMKAGAVEFLSKPVGDAELMRAIAVAIDVDRAARHRRAEHLELQRRYDRLTARERQVLPYVVAGLANKVTASDLGTSVVTIAIHRGHIMQKMGAQSLAELVRLADKLGVSPVSAGLEPP
jgi:FixJ family two-component response regulator